MTRMIRSAVLLSALLALAVPAAAQDALDKRLSLDLKAMTPAEAFKVIATAIGYTVDVAADVVTPVDIVVPNVGARTALDTICDSIGCTWQANGTVITVKKRAPGGLLGANARAHGTAVDGGAATKAELKRRLSTTLPADMKFENAPMATVAERLSKATGLGISFVGTKTGQTLSADLGNRTLWAALKPLTEQYHGAIVLTLKVSGNKPDQIILHLGTANRALKVPEDRIKKK
jgi:hypothetical protein